MPKSRIQAWPLNNCRETLRFIKGIAWMQCVCNLTAISSIYTLNNIQIKKKGSSNYTKSLLITVDIKADFGWLQSGQIDDGIVCLAAGCRMRMVHIYVSELKQPLNFKIKGELDIFSLIRTNLFCSVAKHWRSENIWTCLTLNLRAPAVRTCEELAHHVEDLE